MKKLFLVFAFFGLFTFLTPKVADAVEEDCVPVILVCADGTQHYIVICDYEDLRVFAEVLCGEILPPG